MLRSNVNRPTVIVVGAGAAGLAAAGRMRTWAEVVVVDKGRGVGGRLATRRIGEATLDHGAQFMTTRSAEFTAFVDRLAHDGVVQQWFHHSVGPAGVGDRGEQHVRWRGTRGMSGIAKHLAVGVDVRCGQRVTSLRPSARGWSATVADADGLGRRLDAAAVLVTAPVPQSLELLATGGVELSPTDRRSLTSIEYDPCLAVLAPLGTASTVPTPGAVRPDDPLLAWVADNHLKGISRQPALTLHATPAASRAMWRHSDEDVAHELLGAAAGAIGLEPRVATGSVQVQRWRYSIPSAPYPGRSLLADDLPPLAFAGDAFGGPRVEGAVCSGWAAAEVLQSALERWS